jgi:hypothetical protein
MTSEEIESVVRAMTLTVENLETGPVKQAMQEVSKQVLAHVTATRAGRQRRLKPNLL